MSEPEAELFVEVRLAECAWDWVAAAIDLLVAVENEDECGTQIAAEKLREITDERRW